MLKKEKKAATVKTDLHPRNLHRSRYDFDALTASLPALKPFVITSPVGAATIDFSNADAVKMLNKAILKQMYLIAHWDLPDNYLCPPIPGRADYIHYMADLLAEGHKAGVPIGEQIKVLDIGMGANVIYPMLGHTTYGWQFVGSDIDAIAIRNARKIIDENPNLKGAITCRLQVASGRVFRQVVQADEYFDLTMCNPPFHSSAEEAMAGTNRKWKNLGLSKTKHSQLNFGGQSKELWCPGGETLFIDTMISESAYLGKQCLWFSTLVSKKEKLAGIYKALRKVKALDIRTIEMTQGQKTIRAVAWTFQTPQAQAEWRAKRWT